MSPRPGRPACARGEVVYDPLGHATKIRQPIGAGDYAETVMIYDGVKLTKTIDPYNNVTLFDYDVATGRRTKVTDPLNHATSYVLDLEGRTTNLVLPDGRSLVYAYNAAGQRITETDGLGNSITNDYDPVAGSPSQGKLTKSNNGIAGEAGSLIYQYDGLQRLTHAYATTGNGATQIDYAYMKYNINGQATKLGASPTDPDLSTWTFDSATGRLSEQTYGWLASKGNPLSKTAFSYDRVGRMITKNKGLVQWDYAYRTESPYELTAIRATNARGLTKTTRPAIINNIGQVVTHTLGNGVYSTYAYDECGLVTRMAYQGLTKSGTGMNSLIYTYEYDKLGRRTRIAVDDNSSANTFDSLSAYQYDPLGRLTRETRSGSPSSSNNYTKTYALDAVGNRTALTKLSSGSTLVYTYAYNGGEQLTAMTRTLNGLPDYYQYTFQYDAAGQMTRWVNSFSPLVSFTKTFAWDHLGRLTHVDVQDIMAGNASVDYSYNPQNKRTMRIQSGVTKSYSYQGDNLASVSSSDTPIVHRVYTVLGEDADGGGGIANALERHDVNTSTNATSSQFYLYNDRGDVVAVTDASGNLVSAYDYDAYGTKTVTSGATSDDIYLTGKDYDTVSQMYYFAARWYSPELGVFLSRAPNREDTEHPYTYCANDPVNKVDPSGKLAWWTVIVAIGASIAILRGSLRHADEQRGTDYLKKNGVLDYLNRIFDLEEQTYYIEKALFIAYENAVKEGMSDVIQEELVSQSKQYTFNLMVTGFGYFLSEIWGKGNEAAQEIGLTWADIRRMHI